MKKTTAKRRREGVKFSFEFVLEGLFRQLEDKLSTNVILFTENILAYMENAGDLNIDIPYIKRWSQYTGYTLLDITHQNQKTDYYKVLSTYGATHSTGYLDAHPELMAPASTQTTSTSTSQATEVKVSAEIAAQVSQQEVSISREDLECLQTQVTQLQAQLKTLTESLKKEEGTTNAEPSSSTFMPIFNMGVNIAVNLSNNVSIVQQSARKD